MATASRNPFPFSGFYADAGRTDVAGICPKEGAEPPGCRARPLKEDRLRFFSHVLQRTDYPASTKNRVWELLN